MELKKGGKGKKNDRVSNTEIYYTCAGRGYNDMY
jgi:hypothetical protein